MRINLRNGTQGAVLPGPDIGKKITQKHFEAAMEQVIAARSIMHGYGSSSSSLSQDGVVHCVKRASSMRAILNQLNLNLSDHRSRRPQRPLGDPLANDVEKLSSCFGNRVRA